MTEETYKALSETTIEAVHIVDEPDELVTYIVEVVDYILSSVDVVGTAKAVTKREAMVANLMMSSIFEGKNRRGSYQVADYFGWLGEYKLFALYN